MDFRGENAKKKYPSCVLCLLFWAFWGLTSNKNVCCCFPETNQTTKNAQMTEGTKWQCFKSFGVSCGLFFWNYGNQWKLFELWKPMNAEVGIMEIYQISAAFDDEFWNLQLSTTTDSEVEIQDQFCREFSEYQSTKCHPIQMCSKQRPTRVTAVQFFTELRGKCQFFLRFGRRISRNHQSLRGNFFSRHSLLESR